ncbi:MULTISPECIES: hypothetical protein [Pontibacillus]|uniref:LysM domain-containing protein n=1 Tax=Pontibacillus chungwhensis TaxID=265426 RepID=A0ABY8UTG4_9BACI|nr:MULTISPECIES: hypothetical protein [Pontibacillus]WIF96960.1 hypothetical protein QNI29_14580 [Pontibacillus chungwhensis]
MFVELVLQAKREMSDMNPILKKMLFIITMILFFVSIGHDLTTGTFPKELISKAEDHQTIENETNTKPLTPTGGQERFRVIEHKVSAGDTVLSIMEKLNEDGPPVTIQQMLTDFEALNDGQDPNSIKMNKVYLFPYYHKNEKPL